MNPIIHKQKDLSALLERYQLEPERVELNAARREMVFTFKSRIPECDNISVQRELTGIFDYLKSLSVIINKPENEAQSLTPNSIHKLMDTVDVEALAKKKEQALNKRLQVIKDTPPATSQSSSGGGKKGGATEEARLLTVGEVVMGDKIKRPAQSMGELDFSTGAVLETTNIVVSGRAFGVDSREITDKTTLYTFCITDEKGSVGCKIFARKKNVPMIAENLKKGRWFKIEGSINYDEYSHEKVLTPKNIEIAPEPIRLDTAKEKRVELHLHSQYSSMDAVSKVAKIMKQAKDFGHDAIGITDHGVLQAYPEMMALSKKYGIKALYGVEGYL
ncbi:MAG: PHP domain-containing protein, partial [Eubacterium sp.]